MRGKTAHASSIAYFSDYIQDVPGLTVTTSGFNSRADSESKTSHTHTHTHGSDWQRFRSYKFLKYRNQRTDVGKYSFVNRTITDWNQLTEEEIGALTSNTYSFRQS